MDKFEGNPFYSTYIANKRQKCDFPDTVHSFQRYNVKTKVYKDGSENSTIAPAHIFGSDPDLRSSPSQRASDAFFKNHQAELEHGQAILNRLEEDKIEQKILRNQFYFEMGFIDSSECLERNFSLRSLARSVGAFSVSPRLRDSFGNRLDKLKNSQDRIFDYIMSNDWDWFFTGTIDPQKLDSLDFKACLKPIQNWFKNMVKRYKISYILVFELHPTSGRLHLHGLIKENPDKPLKLTLSDTKVYPGFKKPIKERTAKRHGLNVDNGREVYNLKTWRFGWSTAIKVYGSPSQLAHYCTKYITKDSKKIFGRYFWHSRDLDKPKVIYDEVDYTACNLPSYHGYKFSFTTPDSTNIRR